MKVSIETDGRGYSVIYYKNGLDMKLKVGKYIITKQGIIKYIHYDRTTRVLEGDSNGFTPLHLKSRRSLDGETTRAFLELTKCGNRICIIDLLNDRVII